MEFEADTCQFPQGDMLSNSKSYSEIKSHWQKVGLGPLFEWILWQRWAVPVLWTRIEDSLNLNHIKTA